MTSDALTIRGLTKTYGSDVIALRGIDLSVKTGDFFALLGPNGAGKTTTIGVISSLVTKTAGQVQVYGNDIDTQLEAAKTCLGLVPQEVNFNMFEKVQNIVLNQAGYYGIRRSEARVRTEKYLRELKLWDKRDELSRNLSGGMKRRLMIARALVHEPRLLILDEPTAGVDIEIRRSMWSFLTRLNEQGTTIILTTHYLEEAESLCRNVAIIDGGLITENDRMSNVLQKLKLQTYVLTLANPPAELPELPGFAVSAGAEGTMNVDVADEQSINDLFDAVNAVGLKVVSLRTKSNRLEELFLRLTDSSGSSAQDAA
ncbi:MAG: ATP-binding cassette domain-containing protein [Gammaproteobacteria bacterium]